MAKPVGKRVDVSRKDVFEIKMGDREPVLLSEGEATQLLDRLKTILHRTDESESTNTQPPAAPDKPGAAPPVRSPPVSSAVSTGRKFTPELRRRQNILMAGIIVLIIGAAFVAMDVNTLTAPPAPSFKPPPQPYVHFSIDAGPQATFTFNGTSPGPTLSVPVNTRVWLTFHVDSGAGYPHSWVLVPGSVSPTPTPDFTPVFANASSPNPVAGTPPGGTDQIVFIANAAGSYKYICEFPGHFESGMWGWFNVTSGNSTATVHMEHYHLVAGANGTRMFNGTSPGPALSAPNNSVVWLTLSIPSTATSNHSWILVPGNVTNATSPNYTAVFKNASSPNPTVGTANNTTLQIYFNATRVGNYKYISEVSNDFSAGMWGWLNVTPSNYSALVTVAHSAHGAQSPQSSYAVQPVKYDVAQSGQRSYFTASAPGLTGTYRISDASVHVKTAVRETF